MDVRTLYLLTKNVPVNQPVARVHTTSAQLISTTLSPTWNATDFATNGMIAATSGITVPFQGYYLVQALATFSSSSSSTYSGPASGSFGRIDLIVNGINYSQGTAIAQSASNSLYTSVAADLVYVPQGGVVKALVTASSGGSIYLWTAGVSDTASSYLSLTYVCS